MFSGMMHIFFLLILIYEKISKCKGGGKTSFNFLCKLQGNVYRWFIFFCIYNGKCYLNKV